jgi:hypothetical protein
MNRITEMNLPRHYNIGPDSDGDYDFGQTTP